MLLVVGARFFGEAPPMQRAARVHALIMCTRFLPTNSIPMNIWASMGFLPIVRCVINSFLLLLLKQRAPKGAWLLLRPSCRLVDSDQVRSRAPTPPRVDLLCRVTSTN